MIAIQPFTVRGLVRRGAALLALAFANGGTVWAQSAPTSSPGVACYMDGAPPQASVRVSKQFQ
jgi:hypothetical protein